ncbi:DNA primase [Nitrosophilus alvini]|uniref:DNA primase n=1 Tax=Nitrosophilus alvini TaxID=2714855 RepID=UPI0019090D73|nr:DNA primase [Nitrosophilus alvini]
MIERDSIEQLKNRLDIVDVVGNYIELKKSGANFKALCPFHNEDTPSLVVSPSKQIYHCFGCGAGGDAIKFVMEYEKLPYPEAIEKLASMYNIHLNYTNEKKGHDLHKILEKVNKFYKKMLDSTPDAMKYLKERGVFESSIEKFELGYAPSSEKTINFIKSNFLSVKDAVETGILGTDSKRVYARLIERITFPIYSHSGRLVGFGGRTITGHPAKYINSPQTKLFNKSNLLYGYHIAKEHIYRKKEIIVTEGYLDVIMLHQAGFDTAVATLGTALTPQHLPILRRGEPKVILAYDGDKAGVNAAIKAAKLLISSGIEGGIVLFGEGKDPADMVNESKIEELNKIFHKTEPFYDFVIEKTVTMFDIENPVEKEKAFNECIKVLKSVSALYREDIRFLEPIASKLGISTAKVKKAISVNTKYSKSDYLQTKDTKELSIIKTLLNESSLIDTVLDYIDEEHFIYHKNEFRLLKEGKTDHPKLLGVLLDEDLKTFSEEELRSELLIFLIKYYSQKLKKLAKDKNIDFKEKTFKIRKYREIIEKLKKGELVTYESFGTI